jgi:hypothetical protein
MNKRILISGLIVLFIFLSGCITGSNNGGFKCGVNYFEYSSGVCCLDANSNKICDTDEVTTTAEASTTTVVDVTTTIAVEEFKCGNNYYEYMSGECCLDVNHNELCDSDETTTVVTTTTTTTTVSTTTTTISIHIIPTFPLITIPFSTYCAQHFTKIDASEISMCSGGGSIGGDPITGEYGCSADPNYPPESSCPAGTEMNNLYGYGGLNPGYRCYVPQDIGASSAPAGCPISTVACADKFSYDSANSHLSWSGGGSSWGCYFSCKANPNPIDSNEDWPCTKTGYKPIGGGGGDTCCAIW